MKVKRKDGWYVVSHTTGKNLGGPYKTEAGADKRLKQIRAFKYMKKQGAIVLRPDVLESHIEHIKYLAKHKYHVYGAGRELKLPRWQLIKHDYTKLRPDIWMPYTRWHHGSRGKMGFRDPGVYTAFRRAAKKHYKLEGHHAHKVGKPKSTKYWLESVADSYALARTMHKGKRPFPSLKTWLTKLPNYKWPVNVREIAFKKLNN